MAWTAAPSTSHLPALPSTGSALCSAQISGQLRCSWPPLTAHGAHLSSLQRLYYRVCVGRFRLAWRGCCLLNGAASLLGGAHLLLTCNATSPAPRLTCKHCGRAPMRCASRSALTARNPTLLLACLSLPALAPLPHTLCLHRYPPPCPAPTSTPVPGHFMRARRAR